MRCLNDEVLNDSAHERKPALTPVSKPVNPVRRESYLPVLRPEWLDLHHEDVIDPELPIVDAHHHLWKMPGFVYARNELLADVRSGHNVRATVFVDCESQYRAHGPQALRPVGETEFVVAETAGQMDGEAGLCAGIVGRRLINAPIPTEIGVSPWQRGR